MVKLLNVLIIKYLKEVLTECGHTGRVLLGNKLEFRIHQQGGANEFRPLHRSSRQILSTEMRRGERAKIKNGCGQLVRFENNCVSDLHCLNVSPIAGLLQSP